jgi:hypothetical protein
MPTTFYAFRDLRVIYGPNKKDGEIAYCELLEMFAQSVLHLCYGYDYGRILVQFAAGTELFLFITDSTPVLWFLSLLSNRWWRLFPTR